MNKVFSLFMICAMAVSLTAADTLFFNRYQFQPALGKFETGPAANQVEGLAAITVPFVYNGNLKLTGYGAADNDWINYEYNDTDCFVGKNSVNLPIYMTICQPCLDCYPCTVLGQEAQLRKLDNKEKVGKCGDAEHDVNYAQKALVGSVTRWNLYVVEKEKVDKKEYVTIYKINLMTKDDYQDEDGYTFKAKSVFFTGRKGSGDDSNAYAQFVGVDEKHNATMQFAMIGKKNDYKFNFTQAKLATNGTWTVVKENGKEVKDTAYIKSPTKFDGVFCAAQMYGYHGQFIPEYPLTYNDTTKFNQNAKYFYAPFSLGYQYCGEIKLTRNASLTGMAVKGAFGVTKPKAVSNWEDCDEDIPANYCEEYFKAEVGDKMDEYLEEKVYKSYFKDDRGGFDNEVGGLKMMDHSLADFFEDAVKDTTDKAKKPESSSSI